MVYSVKEISELLNVSSETVRRWIRNDRLKATQQSRKTGNAITEDDFKQFINKSPKYKKMEETMSKINIIEENPAMYVYVNDLDVEIATDIWKIAKKSPEHGNALMDMLGAPLYFHIMNIKKMGESKEEE